MQEVPRRQYLDAGQRMKNFLGGTYKMMHEGHENSGPTETYGVNSR